MFGRRHALVFGGFGNPKPQLAALRIARRDDHPSIPIAQQLLPPVEPHFAFLLVHAMTTHALRGEQRSHLAREIHRRRSRGEQPGLRRTLPGRERERG